MSFDNKCRYTVFSPFWDFRTVRLFMFHKKILALSFQHLVEKEAETLQLFDDSGENKNKQSPFGFLVL